MASVQNEPRHFASALLAEPRTLPKQAAPKSAAVASHPALTTRLRERALIVVLVGALLALGGVFATPVLLGRIPVHGDLGLLNLPIRDFYARCLQQGDAFDWMPQIFGGYFLTGEGQHGPYHPIHWLLYRWLPLDTAFALEVFLPVLLLATGTILFLRKYVNLAGACLGALMAAFSAMFVLHVQHPQVAIVAAHVPWFLAALDAAIGASTSQQRRLACVAVALMTGSQALLGHPQFFWFSLLAGSLFALCMLVARRTGWPGWVAVVAGVSLGLCLGGVQLMTTYSLLNTSVRTTWDITQIPKPHVPPSTFIGMIAPYRTWGGWPFEAIYFGAAQLILMLWWFTAWRFRPVTSEAPTTGPATALPGNGPDHRLAVRTLTLWAFLVAVLTALLSLGIPGKIYYLQMCLPVVNMFRSPFRYLTLTQFCTAILAAIAFAQLVSLVRRGQKMPWIHLAFPWLAAGASVALAVWSAAQSNPPRHLIVGPLLFLVSAAALTLAVRGRQSGLFLLVFVTAFDVGYHCVGDRSLGKLYWRKLPTLQEFVDGCPSPPATLQGRVLDTRCQGLVPAANYLCLFGGRNISGYTGLPPLRSLNYGHINSLRVAEVAWVWEKQEAKRSPPSTGIPVNGQWRPIPDPLPRVRLVSEAVVSENPRQDLQTTAVDTTALVSHHLDLSSSAPGTAELIEDRPGKISIQVEAPARQLLVVSEGYHHGWQARIDSQPAPVERVNGDFFGCVVEKGTQRVEFAFQPASLQIGKLVSLAALVVCLTMAIWPKGRAASKPFPLA